MGLWLTTWHRASIPQVPGQGSWHFCEMQAWFWGHSELTTHSGLHDGGLPRKLGWQEHTARPLVTRHTLFGPQGDGSHGFCGGRAVQNDQTVCSHIYINFLIYILSYVVMLEHLRIYDETILNIYNVFFNTRSFCVTMVVVVVVVV